MAAFAESAMADDAAFDFEPALQTVSGQVTVVQLRPVCDGVCDSRR